jgi:hypothetical protein
MDWDFCEVHGFFAGQICSMCEDQLTIQAQKEMAKSIPTILQFMSANFKNCTTSAPISLGRWEERTEYDRDFLASMGISAE